MKSVLIVAALLALAVIASPASATDQSVGTILWMQPIFNYGSEHYLLMGWLTQASTTGLPSTDGYDYMVDGGDIYGGIDGQLAFDLAPIAGAPASFGPTMWDLRAPDGLDKRWVITAHVTNHYDSHIGGPFGISAMFEPGCGPGNREFYLFEGNVSLANCRAYASANTNYVVKLNQSMTSWNSSFSRWSLPAPTSYTIWDPDANDGEGGEGTAWSPSPTMNFTVYTPASVPEPSSIFALISGLVGVAGLGIRRRR